MAARKDLAITLMAAVLSATAASAAHAFTFNSGDSAGTKNGLQSDLQPYTDPSRKAGSPTANGGQSFQFGGGTVTVGPQRSFSDDYDRSRDRMLSPFSRDGR